MRRGIGSDDTGPDLVEVDMASIVRNYAGDAAILFKSEGGKDVWLPRSQIEFERKRSGEVTVTMPEWLAIEKGLV